MARTLTVLLLLGFCLPAAVGADDEEPVFQTKKLSEWLTILQKDARPERRRAALMVVEQIGARHTGQMVPALLGALRDDKEEKVREGATAALGRVCARLRKDDSETFKFDNIRDALATALKGDRSPRVREAAAVALGKLDSEARGAVAILAASLKDPDLGTRRAAADTLRRLGPAAAEALPDLQQVLRDGGADRGTRVQCVLAIGRIGAPEAVAALSAMKEVLADGKTPAEVRKAVCETLALLGKDAASAAPVLGQTLTAPTSDAALRRAAAVALGELGSEGRIAIPSLKKALKDEDRFVRCHAMHALGQYGKGLGPHARDVITGLLQAMEDSVLEVRVTAIETLGTLGAEGLGPDTQAVVDRLTEAARDSRKAVSEAATAALKKIQGMSGGSLP
jgi:HEAT repeat protein